MPIEAPKVSVSVSSNEFSVNFQGTYSSERTYRAGQWVAFEEGLWACKQTSTENEPGADSEFWVLLGAI